MKALKPKMIYLLPAVALTLAGLVASIFHYTGRAYGNHITWVGWLAGMGLYLAAFASRRVDLRRAPAAATAWCKSNEGVILILLSLVFLLSHFWNFNTAPWNQNGLFDDAAWNVYFARLFVAPAAPFQAAYWQAGSSSAKGVVFHYYITLLFKIFGYNVLTFNLAVLFLAFIAYVVTVKFIHKLFGHSFITILAGLVLNFLPLRFVYSFVGQRYAVAPPLFMGSLYLLITGFQEKSFFRVAASSILAGLCFSGAVMGKQYILALVLALFLSLLFDFPNARQRINSRLVLCFAGGLFITSLPMLLYMYYNPVYFSLEGGYLRQFFDGLLRYGPAGIKEQIDRLSACLFANFTWWRWFIPDFKLLPLPYYLLLVPGLVIATVKKRFELVGACFVNFLAAFVAGFSDYRVLMTSPLWIILMAYAMHFLLREVKLPGILKHAKYPALLAVLLAGLLPCVQYLHAKSKDPYSVYFFTQRDVAVARFLRDIVAGAPEPRPALRRDEFLKLRDCPEPGYDTLACLEYGYAVPHTFLFDYDSYRILSFGGQLPFNLISEAELLAANKRAIAGYRETGKDLRLVWEQTDKSRRVIEAFTKLNKYGYDETAASSHAGRSFSLYMLTIDQENIGRFKEEVERLSLCL